MKAIFKNIETQNKFNQNGFVVSSFLDGETVLALNKLANDFEVDKTHAFYSTSYHLDLNLKKDLDQKVKSLVENYLEKYFENYQYLGSAFLYKQPGEESAMPPHQDWTVVDETQANSTTIWIPLDDLTHQNGAIQCIPQSHQKFNFLRAPSVPFAYQNHNDLINSKMQIQYLKAGDAFIFNHRLVHSSPANLSDKTRIALAIGLIPKNEPLFMYYRSNGSIKKYKMPSDMFIRYPEVAKEPTIGEFISEEKFEEKIMTEEEVKTALQPETQINNLKPLFANPEHQKKYEEDGYLVLPALNQAAIDKLKSYYKEVGIKDEMGYGFHVGMDQKDKALVAQMVDKISGIALPFVKDYLVDFQLFTASFVIKESNPKGLVPPHQDWTFVDDETQHTSVTCWIPLQDVNMDNGCIGVFKGSHKFFDHLRPSPSPQAPSPLYEHMFTIFPYLQLLEMKAGEAVFFNNKTIHASPPNTTDEVRLGVGLGLTQKEAEVRHYYLKPGTKNRVLKYKADADFYKKYDNPSLAALYEKGEKIEDYEVLSEMPYEPQSFTKDEWKTKLKEAGNEFNIPLVEKLADLFDYNVDGSKKEPEPQPEPEPTPELTPQQEVQAENQTQPGLLKRVLQKIFG